MCVWMHMYQCKFSLKLLIKIPFFTTNNKNQLLTFWNYVLWHLQKALAIKEIQLFIDIYTTLRTWFGSSSLHSLESIKKAHFNSKSKCTNNKIHPVLSVTIWTKRCILFFSLAFICIWKGCYKIWVMAIYKWKRNPHIHIFLYHSITKQGTHSHK